MHNVPTGCGAYKGHRKYGVQQPYAGIHWIGRSTGYARSALSVTVGRPTVTASPSNTMNPTRLIALVTLYLTFWLSGELVPYPKSCR
jgi:hypothetical protein